MKRWFRISISVFGIFVLIALGTLVAISNSQAQMLVYNPPEQRDPIWQVPTDYGLDYETITLTSEDNYKLVAWYIPSRNQAAVIVPTGYKDNRADMLDYAHILARHNYGVIVLDLRAHGSSEGDLISFGRYEVHDMEAAYQYLLGRPDVNPERIGELGVSLGGVVVILHAAQNQEIKAVVAESAFASLGDEVATGVKEITGLPSFPFAPMIQWFAEQETGFDADEVAAIEHIGLISPRPVFLLQGGADTVIPSDSGQRLYDAAGEPRELWFEPDLGHSAFSQDLAEEYEDRIISFFDQYLLGE